MKVAVLGTGITGKAVLERLSQEKDYEIVEPKNAELVIASPGIPPKDFPKTDLYLQTENGPAIFQKMDIFNGWLWYAYKENPVHWHKLTVEQTNQIIALNKSNKKIQSLEEFALELDTTDESNFTDLVGQDSLTRFDKPKYRKKRRKSKNSRNRNFRINHQKKNK